MTEESNKNSIKLSIIYFTLSSIITWWFIAVSPVYVSLFQKLLSCNIAGAKWSIQIVAAFVFLQNRKWEFIKNIGFTCLIGSLLLIPYSLSSSIGKYNESSFFIGSLLLSVATMVVSYFLSVKKTGLPTLWWGGWLFCLAIAIALQLKVVFNMNILNP